MNSLTIAYLLISVSIFLGVIAICLNILMFYFFFKNINKINAVVNEIEDKKDSIK